jgi:hypothetical protein
MYIVYYSRSKEKKMRKKIKRRKRRKSIKSKKGIKIKTDRHTWMVLIE